MNRSTFLAGLCALLCAGAAVLGQSPQPSTKPSALDVFKPYIGQWKINATWSGGSPLEARATYDWGLNKRFVVAKTFVKTPDGREYQRYESIFAEKDGQLLCYGFVYSGDADVRQWNTTGARLWNEWTMDGADGTGKFRQSVELVDGHIHWLVERQRDGQWEQLMDGKWERMTAAAAK
jgi:hypothetical protein